MERQGVQGNNLLKEQLSALSNNHKEVVVYRTRVSLTGLQSKISFI